MLRTRSPRKEKISNCYLHSNSLSNKMDNSLLAVRDINHKYIVVERSFLNMAMEDKNTPVQPDAVEATETRGRKVGAARFFELLGRDLWPFYKASILCVLGFAPGYAAVLFSTMAASLPLCLLSGAVGGLIAAPVFCGMLDTILRALRDEPGYWWHTYRMAWKQNWRESLLPGAGAGFCLGLWAFLLYALPDLENVPISVWICMVLGIFFLLVFCLYLFAQVVLVSVSQAEWLKNAALFMI